MDSVGAESTAHSMSRKHWAQHVLEVQSQRNPEEICEARSRIERARQHEVCARKCKAVKGLAVRSRALAAEGLKQMAESKAPSDYLAVQDRWRSAQEVSRSRQQTKCSKLGKLKCKKQRMRSRSSSSNSSGSADEAPAARSSGQRSRRLERADSDSGSSRAASLLRCASDSEEDAMEEAADLVGASDASAMAIVGVEGLNADPQEQAAQEDGGSEASEEESDDDSDAEFQRRGPPPRRAPAPSGAVATLLQQLTQEPTDGAECAAKFSLYEGYASEVENMRNTLFTFHEESTPTLPSAIVTDMDQQLRGIDCAEAMRIPDRSREWFVYHMMRQAERNNMKMAGILDAFDKKLKFLAQNDQMECPVCLDSFDDGAKTAETLGCCHKVCRECWHNWAKVMHGRPFCPFCRHEEFIGAVAARASATHSDSDGDDEY